MIPGYRRRGHRGCVGAMWLLASVPWVLASADAVPDACLACHGAQGRSANRLVPSLGGQPAQYLLVQLYLYREKLRLNEPMNTLMAGPGDEALQRLADALARMPAPVVAADTVDEARMSRARSLIERHRCASCHNPDYSGHDNIPRIGGQREDYLARTLRDYRSNRRAGYDASMAEVLQPISDDQIGDLAYFLARAR